MTDRREFLGVVAAIFCGVTLPEPVRDMIDVCPHAAWNHHGDHLLLLDESVGMKVELDALIKKFYVEAARAAFERDPQMLTLFQLAKAGAYQGKGMVFDVVLSA